MKLEELVTIEKPPAAQKKDAPAEVPGGATVMLLNDDKTPFEVVIEAIQYGTGFSAAEAMKRCMRAHTGGWCPIASYGSADIAQSVADKIMRHAQGNGNYDHYRPLVNHQGPWPLTCEVMDAQQ